MFKLMDKEISTILRSAFLPNWPYGVLSGEKPFFFQYSGFYKQFKFHARLN